MAPVSLSPNGLDQYRISAPPDAVMVGTMAGVVDLRCTDGAWSVAERSLDGVHVSSLLCDHACGAAYAGSHGEGIFRRVAGGGWIERSNGLECRNVFALACSGEGAERVLYAGTEPAYLFRSRDEGASWEELPALRAVPGREAWNFPAPPHVAHTKHIDVDPRDAGTLYISIEQGALLKSTDGGHTFCELQFQDATYVLNKDTHRIVFNPRDPDELFLPGGDGIAHSRDGGATWERLATPAMRVGYPDATFCSPDGDGALYVSGGGTSPDKWRQTGNAHAAFVRSRDGGRTWDVLGLPDLRGNIEAATLVSWPGGFGFFAGTTDGDVYASMDKGDTWALIAAGLPPISKSIHHRNIQIGRGAA